LNFSEHTKYFIKYLYNIFKTCTTVTINSKQVVIGSIFFGLQGNNYDGGFFVQEALDNGAILAILNKTCKIHIQNSKIIYVEDSIKTLQLLASYHRSRNIHIPLLCITGSNGKTTTKNLIVHVLSAQFNILTNYGNFNNHIGVPLTLLSKIKYNDIDLIVIELGASKIGDIKLLCNICKPDYGYITNFGYAHILGFKSLKNVILEKIHLYYYLRDNNKISFINIDDSLQYHHSLNISKYCFSIKKFKVDVFIRVISYYPYINLMHDNIIIYSNIIGKYNVYNMCAAIAISKYFNIKSIKIKERLESFKPSDNRSEFIITLNKNKILLDAYNANLTSMKESIKSFILLCRKYNNLRLSSICIIGDMHELGILETYAHVQIFNLLSNNFYINKFYLVGAIFYNIVNGNKKNFFLSSSLLIAHLIKYPIQNSFILIKGSRVMCLEKLICYL
jgi:UDP-N-acetylmuramoyl-tripeptide--D-alanyl-D-alanine ligase